MALHKSLRIAVVVGIFIGALSGVHQSALAACTSPAGIAGGITWNGTDSVIWCDGTNWYALKNAAGSSGNAGEVQFSGGSGAFSSDSAFTWDNTNKRLGVGTATPAAKLGIVVNDATTYSSTSLSTIPTGSTGVYVMNQNNSDAGYASLMLQNRLASVANGQIAVTGGNTTSALTFGVRPTSGAAAIYEYMRITHAGNVGIGTTSPTYNLSLNENAAQTIGMGRTTAANGYGLTVSAGDAKAATTDRNGGSLVLSSGTATGTGSSGIYFRTATPQASTNTTDNAPTDKMAILGNGYVGMGTASPEYKLHLFDSVGGAEATLLQLHNRSGSNGTAAGIAFSPSMSAGTGLRIVGTQFGNSDTRFQFYTYGPDGSVQRMILHSWGLGIGPASSGLGAQLELNGDRSSAAWTRYGIGLRIRGGPYTDTSSSGTVATNTVNAIYGGTSLAATNATTYTRAATLGIGGAPVAGTNVTLTNPLALLIEGGKSAFWGNVGIYTDGPSYALSFGGEAARTIGVERPTTATNGLGLTVNAGGAQSGGTDLNGGNLTLTAGTSTGAGSSNMYFQTATAGATATTDRAPTTKMTILGSGNVGIGTTTPSTKLEVFAVSTAYAKLKTFTSTAANRSAVLLARSRSTAVGTAQHVLSGDAIGSFLGVSDNGGSESWVGMNVVATEDHTDTAHGMALTFTTSPNNSVSAPERMRIDNNGYVGIGTTTPTALLHLYGSAGSQTKVNSGDLSISSNNTSTPILNVAGGSGADLIRLIGASSAPVLYATSAGSVGIGTATPVAKLDVNGFMRLAKNGSAPATCDATIDGAIALTSQYTLCVCKGGSAAWVRTTDGTTACTW